MAVSRSLTLEGLAGVEDVNRVTTALMEVDGVDSVEVAREWAEIEGQARIGDLVAAVEKAGFRARRA
ncbi:copper chaperone CopZ [Kushneria sinocarnis]|uniref:Copper chaperone CopZ n=1 Tax=Kushneria sinocarnis TaxID=595502 RepID=A0A420WY98_9GAMM|nr:cation transporter [Kushneria sinocarnis]RKR06156.1 copper chaperone CopZ [Kushneria sinocarnis]